MDFVAGIFPTLSSCWLCGWLPLYAIWAWWFGIALIIGFIYALSMIFQSTEIVMSMNGAREVDEQTAPDLYHVVEDMAMVAQIPMPRIFIIDDPALNAFATGSNPQNAAVAATSGLLAIMNREELEAVMGHEVSHIRNYDIRISTIACCPFASAITMLSSMAGRYDVVGVDQVADEVTMTEMEMVLKSLC